MRAVAHLNLPLDAKHIAENFFAILNEAFGNFDVADIHGDDAILDFKNDKLASDFHRPVALIMQYTGYVDFTRNDPLTFAVVGKNDWIASPGVME